MCTTRVITITKRKFHGVILAYKPSKSANLWLHPVKTPPTAPPPRHERNQPPIQRPVCLNNIIRIHRYTDYYIIYYYNNKRRNIITIRVMYIRV